MRDIHIISAIIRMPESTTVEVSQWAYGLELNFIGITLPDGFEAHFCNVGDAETKTSIGSNNRVRVLDEYLETGKDIKCYLFLHDSETDGRTVRTITIPIVKRPKPSDVEPTPVQQDAITQAIGALNRAVAQTAQDVESADASAESARADAESAQASATTAVESAQSAQASATSASQSATSASASAQSATTKAGEASQSATQASTSATQAGASATSASQSAQTATTKASEASASASTASTKASEASTSATTASTKASEASASATSAQTAQTAAEGSATTAQTAAQTATQKAAEAAESARTLTIDPTLAQSGQAADAKATGEIKAELNRFDGGSVNLLNPSEFMEGKYLVDGGGLSDNSGLTASGFFKVEGDATYYLYRSNTYQVRVCFYTDDSVEGYVYRSLVDISSSTPTFTAPATAKYARISTNKTMILDMGIYVTDIRYYVPYRILLANDIGIDNQLDPTLADSKKASPADVVGEIKKHVVFPEKCIKYGDSGMIVDERLDLTTGNIVTNSSNQTRTDFIPVGVGDYLQTCAIRDICLYNGQFEYLGYINIWSSNDNVTPPDSWSGNYNSNITKIEAINGVNPSYIRCWGRYDQYPPAITLLDKKPYEVLNLGDSIFGNNEKPWDLGTYIQNITGLKSANCGYGGTTARVISSGNMSPLGLPSIVDCIVAEDFTPLKTPSYWASLSEFRYTVPTLLFPMVDFSKIKIITIAYGTNDYNSNTPLDNTENRLDTSTYCGGLRYAIEHLQAKYPNIIIMLFSPIYRYWSDSSDYSTVDRDSDSRTNTLGLKLTDYVDAMKSVADEYHLPYFDNYRNIGLNRYTAPAWLRDGTHLNRTTGVEKLGHRIAREVETVY